MLDDVYRDTESKMKKAIAAATAKLQLRSRA